MVEIVPYQQRWPGEFASIAADLRRALGDLALRIDHIGSTSVPGLDAKDVIDIQVSVAALDDRIAPALTGIGLIQRAAYYDHIPPTVTESDGKWEKLLFGRPPGQRRTNVHVRILGRGNQRYALLFRDYLRAHPASAEAYARLKRALAAQLPDIDAYADTKDPAVDLIWLAANDWAAATGWQAGPSDG